MIKGKSRATLGIFVIIFALLLIGLFGWSLIEADANTRSSVIGLIGMIAVGIAAHYQTKKREIAARHFSEKRKGYMTFIDLFFGITQAQKTKKHLSDKQLVQKFLPFKKALLIWGGGKIIDLWNSFEIKAISGQSPEEAMSMMEDILRAIRSDLGHDDSALQPGSLVALILVAKDKNKVLDNPI